MEHETIQQHEKAIAELEKNVAVTNVKLDTLTQNVIEIKTNHLVHINDQLVAVNALLNTKFDAMTQSFADVYRQIENLKLADAKQSPGQALFNKIIEYLVLAVLGAGMIVLLGK